MSRRHLSQNFIFSNDEAEALYQDQQRVAGSSNNVKSQANAAHGKSNSQNNVVHVRDVNDPTEHERRYRNYFQTFPQKLHMILSSGDHDEVISWLEDGYSWKVHDKDRFIEELMPKYFESTKWKSFLRQVTGWGFKRSKLS